MNRFLSLKVVPMIDDGVASAADLVQVVLAAGLSRRMGRCKALLDFDGRSALELILHAAASAGVHSSVVVLGADAKRIRREHPGAMLPLAVEWVLNPRPESEQIDSLKIGLETRPATRGRGFFIHPVDTPLALGADYRALVATFDADLPEERDDAVYFLSHSRRCGHPVLCGRNLRAKLLALPERGTTRDVLQRAKARYVESGNEGVLADMDTPEDYERLLALYRARSAR